MGAIRPDPTPTTMAASAEQLEVERARTRVHRDLRDGNPAQALSSAEQFLRLSPRHPGAWYLLCLALSANERYAEAEVAARSGLTYDADHAPLWFSFGELAHRAGNLELAHHCYRRCATLDPEASLPWARAAVVLHAMRRCGAALRACRQARDRGYPDVAELDDLERGIRERTLGSCRRSGVPLLWPAAAALVGVLGWTMARTPPAEPAIASPQIAPAQAVQGPVPAPFAAAGPIAPIPADAAQEGSVVDTGSAPGGRQPVPASGVDRSAGHNPACALMEGEWVEAGRGGQPVDPVSIPSGDCPPVGLIVPLAFTR